MFLNKVTWLIFSLLFLILIDAGKSVAGTMPGLSFRFFTDDVVSGDRISVVLHVENLDESLAGLNTVIGFDNSYVELESVTKPAGGSIIDPTLIYFTDFDNEKGQLEISSVREGGPAPDKSGDLFILNFRAIRAGECTINYVQAQLRDENNNAISFTQAPPLQITIRSGQEKDSLINTVNQGHLNASNTGESGVGEHSSAHDMAMPLVSNEFSGLISIKLEIGNLTATANNQALFMDAIPYTNRGRSYFPIRFVAESFGGEVNWDPGSRKVLIIRGKEQLELQVGSNLLIKGDNRIYMDVVPELIPPGRLMLPVRYISEALGADVTWSDKEKAVTISLKPLE